jgi:hypothetical protein
MTISDVMNFLFGHGEGLVDRVAVWTAILVAVAWVQLRKLRKTTSADFAQKLIEGFFSEDTRNLMVLLFSSAIDYTVLPLKGDDGQDVIDERPYFKIRESIFNQFKNAGLINLPDWRKGYNECEIDDFLLGYLDDVGRLERAGLIDFETANSTLGYYILELVGETQEVKSYLNHRDIQGAYPNLHYIHGELSSYKAVEEKCCCIRFLWHIRHRSKRIMRHFTGLQKGTKQFKDSEVRLS